ncbi:MAG: GDSL-type esterase/lipase family protein [Nitriliruptoraceae bacterium]
MASATVALHATHRVRRLRARGAEVVPLVHHLDLPGRFPPRWLVVLGDSAAAGHGLADAEEAIARRIGRGLHGADGRATAVRSVAVDGATTAEVLDDQIEAARDAEVVIVGVGVNDALRVIRTRSEVADTTYRLLRVLQDRAAEGASTILITCPDLSTAPGLPPVLRPIVGRRCRTIARAQEAVARMLGVATLDLERDRLPPEVFGSDGFHPGEVGNARLAARVVERLRSEDDAR